MKKILLWLLIIPAVLVALVALFLLYFNYFDSFPKNTGMTLAVSYNLEYAQFLGLDYKQAYLSIIKDLDFKYVRLSAEWDTVNPEINKFDFSKIDWLMNESALRGVKVTLAIGQKTPRWPECHIPNWAANLSLDERIKALYAYDTAVVERYKNSPALEIWQVENEPFLGFGVCPPFSQKEFFDELALVKKIDPNHLTLVSDSGELSMWKKTALAADLFGTTLYRVVWNKVTGYWNYDWLPAIFYRLKLKFAGRMADTAFVTELQAEPWLPNGTVMNTSLAEQYKSMNLQRLQTNIAYSQNLGMSRAYLWGAEWWLWLKSQGESQIYDYIKNLSKN